MNRWLVRGCWALLGLAVIGAGALLGAAYVGERKMQRRIDVPVAPVAWRSDAASVERGRYLFMSRGCTECHGVDGAGKTVIDDGRGMNVRAPNITPGPGNVVAAYRDDDWTRTLRHGIKPDGRPAILMPSEDTARLTDADLAALVAYLRQMPAAAGGAAIVQLPLPVKALYAVGLIRDAAEKIDHQRPPPAPQPDAVTPQHGAYVANACIGCHGAALAGGRVPGAPPDWPIAANLTPGEGSVLGRYPDAAAFAAMLRSGRRPDGSAVSPVMPFIALKELNDTDVQAIYLHLKTLPARATGAN